MTDTEQVINAPIPASKPPLETISNEDRAILEIAKMKRQVALAEAQRALAQNESAEIAQKYTYLQLFMKHGLNPDKDIIDENGIISRNIKSPKSEIQGE